MDLTETPDEMSERDHRVAWSVVPVADELRRACLRCIEAGQDPNRNPTRGIFLDARDVDVGTMLWLTSTGMAGGPFEPMEQLASLKRGTFDDWTPNEVSKLIDGTGGIAQAVVAIWYCSTPAERAEALAEFPSETAPKVVATARMFNTLMSDLATRYAAIYEVVGTLLEQTGGGEAPRTP